MIFSKKVNTKCPYFTICGGCQYQDLKYESQLEIKKKKLEEIFVKEKLISKIEIVPSKEIYSYRNKVDIPITNKGIGFKKKGSWSEIVEIESCDIFGDNLKKIIFSLRKFMKDFNLSPWDLKNHSGFMRYIVVREGKFTEDIMINIITSEGCLPEEVKDYFKATSIHWCVNDKITDISVGKVKKFWGEKYIKEKLNGIYYFVGPNSFFQSNPFVTEEIIKYVSNLVSFKKVLDAYCGVGTFSLYLAKMGKEVEAFDNNHESIEIAKENSIYNGLKVNFFVADDKTVKNFECESLIVDPPRAGLHPNFIKTIKKITPKEIIYVSCNPLSLKENIIKLNKYKIINLMAFDMFPQTEHIECVAKLIKK
ncbi:MAG: 23S rRNA (uracil(1939)-C(5))-methyltransferase RlmD [Candidatus Pacearchaeota archaeon]